MRPTTLQPLLWLFLSLVTFDVDLLAQILPLGNGHLYEFVPSPGVSWQAAEAAAASRSHQGMRGHLATIANPEENLFVASLATATGFQGVWIGARTDAAGVGYWTAGPERSQVFSNGQVPVPGYYANWCGIEPNNNPGFVYMNIGSGFAYAGIGQWLDDDDGVPNPTSDPVIGYFVEYECDPVRVVNDDVPYWALPDSVVAPLASLGVLVRLAPDFGPVPAPGKTFHFDGNSWSLRTQTGPGGRFGHRMASDGLWVYLYGGRDPSGLSYLGDTWKWNGSIWVLVNAANNPPAVSDFGMTYDSNRQRVIIYGGRGAQGVWAGTWEMSTSGSPTWVSRANAGNLPGARVGAALAYDPSRMRTVLYGGVDQNLVPWYGTLEWDGVQWHAMFPSGAIPTPQLGADMVYNPAVQGCYYFGRENGELMHYDGVSWRNAGGVSRSRSTLGVLPTDHRLIVTGGFDATNVGQASMLQRNVAGGQLGYALAGASYPPSGSGVFLDRVVAGVCVFGGVFSDASTSLYLEYSWNGQSLPQANHVQLLGGPIGLVFWEAARSAGPGGDDVVLVLDAVGGCHTYRRTQPAIDFQFFSSAGPGFQQMFQGRSMGSCYDVANGRHLFAGKPSPGNSLVSTWSFRMPAGWSALVSPAQPMYGDDFSLAYDARRDVPVMCATDGMGTLLISELRGQTWVLVHIGNIGVSMVSSVYDRRAGGVLLAGGFSGAQVNQDVWLWDGTALRPHARLNVGAGVAIGVHGMASDSATGETWLLHGSNGLLSLGACGTVTELGQGCSSQLGQCVLEVGGAVPGIGRSLLLSAANLGTNSLGVASVGFSSVTWNGVALPYDLGPSGAPGCYILCASDATTLLFTDGAGRAAHGLGIPNATELVGVRLLAQFLALAPVNPMGLVTTNALDLTIGDR